MQENNEEKYSPYCPICSACGEDGCCSPLACKNDPEGHYCDKYRDDLRFGYAMHEDIMKIIYEDEEIYGELIEKIDKQFDKNYEKYYKNRFLKTNESIKKENDGDSKS